MKAIFGFVILMILMGIGLGFLLHKYDNDANFHFISDLINLFVAIGTISATVVALYLSNRKINNQKYCCINESFFQANQAGNVFLHLQIKNENSLPLIIESIKFEIELLRPLNMKSFKINGDEQKWLTPNLCFYTVDSSGLNTIVNKNDWGNICNENKYINISIITNRGNFSKKIKSYLN